MRLIDSSGRSTLAAVSFGIACALASASARGETLADAIAMAYATNPTIQAQRATQRATDETFIQARTGYEPTANIQGQLTTDNSNVLQTSSSTSQPTLETQSSSAQLVLTQPLYTGGRVASQVAAAQATVLAGRQTLRATEQTVLQSVIQAYVDVRHDQQTLAIAQETVRLLQRQLDEINARYRVGEITRTDVAQTQQRIGAARAIAVTAAASLDVSRAAYRQVVGQLPGDLAPEPSLDLLMPKTIDEADSVAVATNPQLLQADYTERVSAARVAAAKAQTRPTLSLQGTASYQGSSLGANTPFARFGHDLTASAVATLPLSTGGLTSSQIRQAIETNAADRIGIETARRQVFFLVAQAWRQLAGLKENVVIDSEAVESARIAFDGSSQEGKLGLRTPLDVLISEQDLFTTQITLADARRDEYLAATALLVSIGRLEAKYLAPGVASYDPKSNFDRVKAKQFFNPLGPAVAAVDRAGAPNPPPPPAVATAPPPPALNP